MDGLGSTERNVSSRAQYFLNEEKYREQNDSVKNGNKLFICPTLRLLLFAHSLQDVFWRMIF